MFSSMTFSRLGRVIAVTAMASTAVALLPQHASAFVFGTGSGGMMSGGGNQNYGAGTRGHVPGYFGSDYSGSARAKDGPGGRRITRDDGFGGRHQPRGGVAGREGSRDGFARRHEPRGGIASGPKHGVAANPVASLGRGSVKGPGPKGPVRQFGRLGPAVVRGGPGYGQPVAPAGVAPPPVVYQAPAPTPVAANPAPAYQPPVYQPPAYRPTAAPPSAGPVAANPAPAYPTYQPAAPAPQAFVAKAPDTAPDPAPVGGAPPACAAGSYVTVAFKASVTTEDVKTFLAAYNVTIVAGPEADGTYRIQLSTCPLTPAEMTQVVDSMRSQTAIIAQVRA